MRYWFSPSSSSLISYWKTLTWGCFVQLFLNCWKRRCACLPNQSFNWVQNCLFTLALAVWKLLHYSGATCRRLCWLHHGFALKAWASCHSSYPRWTYSHSILCQWHRYNSCVEVDWQQSISFSYVYCFWCHPIQWSHRLIQLASPRAEGRSSLYWSRPSCLVGHECWKFCWLFELILFMERCPVNLSSDAAAYLWWRIRACFSLRCPERPHDLSFLNHRRRQC